MITRGMDLYSFSQGLPSEKLYHRIARLPRGLKLPPQGCFTLSEVQAMSRGGIIISGRKIKKIRNFPLDFLCLLYYTHYPGDWWLYLTEDNDWPPRG